MSLSRASLWLALAGTLAAPAAAAAFRYAAVGATPPSLVLADVDGRPITVPQRGRAAVVVFWRAGQELSEEALADAAELGRRRAGEDVDVVAVAEAGTEGERLRSVAARHRLRVAVDRDGRAAEAWGLIVYPSTGVVGRDGRLLGYVPSRPSDYRRRLDAHLVSPGGKAASTPAAVDQLDRRIELGWTRLDAGDANGALREFEAALALAPGSPRALMGVGVARVRRGETDEGIRIIEQALRLTADGVRGHWELGRAYESRGDHGRAVEHYRAAYLKLLEERK